MDDLKIFSGNANRPLAEKICQYLGVPLGEAVVGRFSDGEISVEFRENVRGRDVFVIQPTCIPCNEHLMELLLMMDALRRASAGSITAVVPYYAYARQDRKTAPRVPISAKLVANLITCAGAHRLLTMDLHTGQIQGFFDFPVDHLTAVPLLASYQAERLGAGAEVTVVSPDAGGGKLARRFANHLADHGVRAELAFIDKRRPAGQHNVAVATEVVGVVRERHCLLVDDMIDTGGTVASAAALLMDRGAASVSILATHPLLSGPAVERLRAAPVREVVVTNTLPVPPEKRWPQLVVLSIAPIVAEALDAVFEDTSVSELFKGDNV